MFLYIKFTNNILQKSFCYFCSFKNVAKSILDCANERQCYSNRIIVSSFGHAYVACLTEYLLRKFVSSNRQKFRRALHSTIRFWLSEKNWFKVLRTTRLGNLNKFQVLAVVHIAIESLALSLNIIIIDSWRKQLIFNARLSTGSKRKTEYTPTQWRIPLNGNNTRNSLTGGNDISSLW